MPAESWLPLDPRRVEVGGVIGERIERTWRGNLLQLDWDRDFLAPFEARESESGYIGLGKSLEAVCRLAAWTGDADLGALRRRLLDRVARAQQADGYLGIMVPDRRVSTWWDLHEIAYLIQALVVDAADNDAGDSAEVAARLGTWVVAEADDARMAPLGERVCAHLSLIGLDRAMLGLYRLTADERFLDFAIERLGLATWDFPIVEGRRERVEGHAYAYFARCLAQLELYQLTGDPALLTATERALAYLRSGGLVISGTCSQSECWHSDQRCDGELGETCATGYWIRLLDQLVRLRGGTELGDYMERALYNALFAAQSPDGRRLRYYSPGEGDRKFWERDTYCCPGNFRRIIAELPRMLYYRTPDGLAVNLYAPSRAPEEVDGVAVELACETDYPRSGRVLLTVNPSEPATFTLRLRRPGWADQAALAVNGEAVTDWSIAREWRAGDQVSLDLAMSWRFVAGLGVNQGRVALMHGPVVFGADPGRQDELVGDPAAVMLRADGLSEPEPDDTRPGGLTATAVLAGSGRAEARLTDFPDPGLARTYLLLDHPETAVPDHLLSRAEV